MSTKYVFNPLSDQLDAQLETNYQYKKNAIQTTSGSTVNLMTIPIPVGSTAFIELVIMGKLQGGEEHYVELVSYRVYRPLAGGNVVQIATAVSTVSENFVTNPARAVNATTSFSLGISSGGVQTINWVCNARYLIKTWGV